MCLDCSGRHRSLGVHLSFVRSVQMDSWNDRQVASMRLGGNAQLNAFLAQFGVADLPIEQKYRTAAAALYREQIVARRNNEPVPEDVSLFEAEAEWPPRPSASGGSAPSFAPVGSGGSSAHAPPARGFGSEGPRMTAVPAADPFEEEAERVRRVAANAWSLVSSAVWTGAQQVSESGRQLSSRVAESGWTESVSQRVSHLGTSLREADLVNRVQSGTVDWFSKAATATSSFWNSATEPVWTWIDDDGNERRSPQRRSMGAVTVPVNEGQEDPPHHHQPRPGFSSSPSVGGGGGAATGVSAGAAAPVVASSRSQSGVAPSVGSTPSAYPARGASSAPAPVAASTLEGFDWDMAWGDESDGEEQPSAPPKETPAPLPAENPRQSPHDETPSGTPTATAAAQSSDKAAASDPDPSAFDEWDDFDDALNAQLAEIDLGEPTTESTPTAAARDNTTTAPSGGDGDDVFASVGLKP